MVLSYIYFLDQYRYISILSASFAEIVCATNRPGDVHVYTNDTENDVHFTITISAVVPTKKGGIASASKAAAVHAKGGAQSVSSNMSDGRYNAGTTQFVDTSNMLPAVVSAGSGVVESDGSAKQTVVQQDGLRTDVSTS